MSFYSDLFGAEPCRMDCRCELLEGLPKLNLEQREALDCERSLKGLTTAVNQMTSGRAPGIVSLTTDFFKKFWKTRGRIYIAFF